MDETALSFSTRYRQFQKKAGLEHVHAHLLKHTAVTWQTRRGVPMEDVSLYTDTTVETLRRAYRQHAPDMHDVVSKSFR